MAAVTRRLLGAPLRSDRLGETLLPKRLALPVFCSDPLSSVAYATEQIVLVLGLGGLSLLYLTPWVAVGVVALLVIVVASYRQTCHAYPDGGGAYAVSRRNLGEDASLVAASALLIDYVLTVAVSVVAGVAAITSAEPSLVPHAVALSLACVVLLSVANLRGSKESGRLFAIPTYGFVLIVFAMLAVGFGKELFGSGISAESAPYHLRHVAHTGGLLTVFLVLRAFASGCTALTGVEAVSNGVPAFEPPKSRNAAATLAIMGSLAIAMFVGITILAVLSHVHMAEDPANLVGFHGEQRTALSQIAIASFGQTVPFYVLNAFTAAVLILAANTAFNGFPVLASLLGRDQFLPHQLAHRGDRLVFSNGIVLLAGVASILIVVFDASVTRLIQLYILGVFVSFTLSQAGMVRHWTRERDTPGVRKKQLINLSGAIATGVVFVIVLVTKFAEGAWIVVLLAPVLFMTMKAVRRHYERVGAQLAPAAAGVALPGRIHAVVLVSNLLAPTLRALAFAQAMAPESVRAVHVAAEESDALPRDWEERGIPIALVVLESPFRETIRPVRQYVRGLRRENPGDVISIVIPEYLVARWWQHVLHNQTALRLKSRLLFEPSVTVTSVPWVLEPDLDASRATRAVR
ncbi:MAG TPA: APC family permease [Solirubrobacteraceae bacterium]|nr:APC family permease [Solirubrobacteraceae bacterium]